MFTRKYVALDQVQIFIDDNQLEHFYAEAYYLYKSHLNFLVQRHNRLKFYSDRSNRKKYFDLLIKAYHQNINNVEELVSILKNYVSLEEFEKLKINATDNTETTLKDFIYLIEPQF